MAAGVSSQQGTHATQTPRGLPKCKYCRQNKKKCVPTGPWEQNGEKNKCELCKKYNHPCSAPEKARQSEPYGDPSSQMPDVGKEIAMVDESNGEDVKKSLERLLKDLDALLRACKYLDDTLVAHRERQRQIPSDVVEYKTLPDLTRLENDLKSSNTALLSKLDEAEENADEAAALGANTDAERAYLRIREVYTSLPVDGASPKHRSFLKKMAAFFGKIEDPFRTERYLLECAGLCAKAGVRDEELWSDLQQVAAETSSRLDRELEIVRNTEGNAQVSQSFSQTAFPFLHRISGKKCISSAPPQMLAMGSIPDITGSPLLHDAVTKDSPVAFEIIKHGREEQLEQRDSFDRTPMFLMALYMAETMGFALMTRYMDFSAGSRKRLVDARDRVGSTVLATAIRSNCSFEFIHMLIVNCCADVDPDPMKNVDSPLQAAAIRGREDVTKLLLTYGAQDGNHFFNGLSASDLARRNGHKNIEALIVKSKPSLLAQVSGPPLGWSSGFY